VPGLSEQDRVVESSDLRVGLRERRVDVGTGDLPPGRNRVVVHAAPGGDGQVSPLFVLEVAPEGKRDDRDLGSQVVKPNAARFVAVKGERPDVAVLAIELRAQELDQRGGETLLRECELHAEQARGFEKAAEVVARPENEELLLLGVPVPAEPGETGRAVVQRMSQDADPGLGVWHDVASEERVAGQEHGDLLTLGIVSAVPANAHQSNIEIHFVLSPEWS
jgi:hypothetical protein